MPEPVTKAILDELALLGCDMPGCSHKHDPIFYFHSRCHPTIPVAVKYNGNTGTLIVECGKCEMLIVEVEVAG